MLRRLTGFALAAGLAAAGAQAQEVAGTWAVDFDQLIRRMPDGRDSVAQRGKAQLVIEVKGDSAFGIWTTESRSMKLLGVCMLACVRPQAPRTAGAADAGWGRNERSQ